MKEITNKLNKTLEIVANRLEQDKWTKDNDLYCGLLDIKEELQSNYCNLERINYKLFVYFENPDFHLGNELSNGDIFVSKLDLTKENVLYLLDKALDSIL